MILVPRQYNWYFVIKNLDQPAPDDDAWPPPGHDEGEFFRDSEGDRPRGKCVASLNILNLVAPLPPHGRPPRNPWPKPFKIVNCPASEGV